MADAGAVELMRDCEPMARALLKIQHAYATNPQFSDSIRHEQVRQEAYIYRPKTSKGLSGSFTSWLSTHPSIRQRLAALGYKEASS